MRVTGERGQAMNVNAEFDIETLDDWMPGASGSCNGRFHVTGKWPAIAIKGDVNGKQLALLESSARVCDHAVDMKNPLHPQGAVTLSAAKVRAPRFEFETVAFEASGDERAHTADLTAVGEQLSVEMQVKGARQGKGWSGTVDELRLSAPQVANLALKEPAQVTWSPGAFSVSQSCLVGEGIGSVRGRRTGPEERTEGELSHRGSAACADRRRREARSRLELQGALAGQWRDPPRRGRRAVRRSAHHVGVRQREARRGRSAKHC